MADAEQTTVPPELIALLGCPRCGEALRAGAGELRCSACAASVPVRERVPYFVPPPPRPTAVTTPGEAAGATRWLPAALRPRHHGLNLDDFSSSTAPSVQLREFLDSFGADEDVANVGSLGTDFEIRARVWNLDLAPVPQVSVVGDGHALPFRPASLDGVVLKNVLEHVEDPLRVVAECRRALKPGGRLFAKIPFLQPFHAEPTDFFRFSQGGVRKLFEDWEILDEGVAIGPGSAVTWIVLEWYQALSPFRGGRALRGLHFAGYWLLSWLMLPIKYLDRLARNHPEAHRVASCLYVEARKPRG